MVSHIKSDLLRLIGVFLFLNVLVTGAVRASPSLPQPVSELEYKWKGMMNCYGKNILFDIAIKDEGGNRLSAIMEAKAESIHKRGWSRSSEKFTVKMHGNYDPSLAMFSLGTINAPNNQRFSFTGVFEPSSKRIAARVESRYYTNCSYAIAGRNKSLKKTIKKISKASYVEPKPYYSRERQPCDETIRNWQAQAGKFPAQAPKKSEIYAALRLFQDDMFKPFFSESLGDISKNDAARMAFQLETSCSPRQSSRKNYQISRLNRPLSHVLLNKAELSRGHAFIYPVASKIVSDWRRLVQERLMTETEIPGETMLAWAEPVRIVTLLLWPDGAMGVDNEIKQAKQRINDQKLIAQVNQLIDGGPKDIPHLLRLGNFKAEYPRSALPQARRSRSRYVNSPGLEDPGYSPEGKRQAFVLISKVINEYAVTAARNLASSTRTIEETRVNLEPLRTNASYYPIVKHLHKDKVDEIEKIYRDRQKELVTGFVADEMVRLNSAMERQSGSLADLGQLVAWEKELSQKYGRLMKTDEFYEFNRLRRQYRRQVLARNEKSLVDVIRRSAMVGQVDETLDRYLYSEDYVTAAGESVLLESKSRKNILAPFSDLAAGDYLNTVYTGDINAIKLKDKEYVAELMPLIRQSTEMTKNMLPLFKLMSGGMLNERELERRIDKSVKNLSLVKHMMAVYLFNYQVYSKQCLKKNHTEFTVTETRPDIVTRNGLGIEISRIYGGTTVKKYRINREFSDIFRHLGKSKPESISLNLVDRMFNKGKIGNLTTGVKTMMNTYPCNSKTMKKMEKNMSSLYQKIYF